MVGPFCWDSLTADYIFQLPAAYFKQQTNSYLVTSSSVFFRINESGDESYKLLKYTTFLKIEDN